MLVDVVCDVDCVVMCVCGFVVGFVFSLYGVMLFFCIMSVYGWFVVFMCVIVWLSVGLICLGLVGNVFYGIFIVLSIVGVIGFISVCCGLLVMFGWLCYVMISSCGRWNV